MELVVVTGASGFIARHVTAALREHGFAVRGLSRASRADGFVAVDFGDDEALVRALDGAAAVLHIAGLAHISSRGLHDPVAAFRAANAQVTANVARASVRASARLLVVLSSAGVLGPCSPPKGFDELSPPEPYDPYTRSKYEAELRAAEEVRTPLRLEIVRPPMVYGPGAPGSYRRLCRLIERRLPLPLGRVDAPRSVIGIRNLSSLLLTLLTREARGPARPMLAADTEPVSVADFARRIAAAHGRRVRLLPVPKPLLRAALYVAGLRDEYRRVALPFDLRPSSAHERFGWRPPYSTGEELEWAAVAQTAGPYR